VTAILRPGTTRATRGASGVLERGIRRLKPRPPLVQIVVRGDAGFSWVAELGRPRFLGGVRTRSQKWFLRGVGACGGQCRGRRG